MDGHLLAVSCMVEKERQGLEPFIRSLILNTQGSWFNPLSKVLPPNSKEWQNCGEHKQNKLFWLLVWMRYPRLQHWRNSGETGFSKQQQQQQQKLIMKCLVRTGYYKISVFMALRVEPRLCACQASTRILSTPGISPSLDDLGLTQFNEDRLLFLFVSQIWTLNKEE